MSKVRGVLEKAYRNDKGFYSISVNNVWYGTYKTDYKSLEGQDVEFEAEQKGNFWNAKDVKPVAAAAPAAGGTAPAQTADARQKSIVLQSSYKTAAETFSGLVAADKLNLGAKAAAFDNALGMLDEIARHIFNNCIDPDAFINGDEEAPGPAGGDEYKPHEA